MCKSITAILGVSAVALAGCVGPFVLVDEPFGSEPTPVAEPVVLAGEVVLAPPGPLPVAALVRVTLLELGDSDQAAASVVTVEVPADAPKPIAFALAVPADALARRDQLALRSEIVDAEGIVRWRMAEPLPVRPGQNPGPFSLRVAPISRTAAMHAVGYSCDGLRLSVLADRGTARVSFPDGLRVLPRVRAASGSKYGDGDNVFWQKGRTEAAVSRGGADFQPCIATTPVAEWGAGIQAQGDQPFWFLRVLSKAGGDGIELVIGAHTPTVIRTHSLRREVVDAATVSYSGEHNGDPFSVRINDSRCTNNTTVGHLPLTIDVRLGRHHYRGCGRRYGS